MPAATFVRFEGYWWMLYLRFGRLLVWAGSYATRAEALAEFERQQADELDALAEQWDEYLSDWQEQESA